MGLREAPEHQRSARIRVQRKTIHREPRKTHPKSVGAHREIRHVETLVLVCGNNKKIPHFIDKTAQNQNRRAHPFGCLGGYFSSVV
jgi:hypothetical protein